MSMKDAFARVWEGEDDRRSPWVALLLVLVVFVVLTSPIWALFYFGYFGL